MRQTKRKLDGLEQKANAGKLHKLTIRYEASGLETVSYAPGLEQDTVIVIRESHDWLGENEEPQTKA